VDAAPAVAASPFKAAPNVSLKLCTKDHPSEQGMQKADWWALGSAEGITARLRHPRGGETDARLSSLSPAELQPPAEAAAAAARPWQTALHPRPPSLTLLATARRRFRAERAESRTRGV
jgi:hypothetical protein